MLKLVKLILSVPAINAVIERSCLTLHRFKFYLRSSITQELPSSFLIIAICNKKVDKLKLVEEANHLKKQSTSLFHLKTNTSPESLPKVLTPGGAKT